MKKLIIVSLLAVLTGCATSVPVARKFPDAPDELKVACPNLATIDPASTKLSDVVTVTTGNYGLYHECKGKVEDWATWYKTQKEIFDSVK